MAGDFFEQVAADKNQLGFDYQDLVCLEYLIDIKQGESVGLKHSVDDTDSVTNRDVDLWKTLYNWSNALEQLPEDDVQLIFFTNKKMTVREGFVKQINETTINLSDIEDTISLIKEDIDKKEASKDKEAAVNPIKKYVDYIHSLTSEEKENLFK